MKLKTKFKGKNFNKDNRINLIFEVSPYMLNTISELENKEYILEVKEDRAKRSNNQNALLWELITQICLYQDGHTNDKDVIYLQLLQMADVSSFILTIKHDALEKLKKSNKYLRVLKEDVYKGEAYDVVEVFNGSSTFNTKEMTELLRVALNYAHEVGVNTDIYVEELRGII